MRTMLPALLFTAVVWAVPVRAAPTPVVTSAPAALQALGWQMLTFEGIPPTRFRRQADGAIVVEARSSSAVLFRRLAETDRGHTLTWRWMVRQGLPPTPQDRKGADDRALAVHVWFGPRLGTSGLFKTLAGALGFDVPGRVLTYAWGGQGVQGEVLVNPHYADEGRIIVLRGGRPPERVWLAERVDLKADYRRAFGDEAPAPSHIAVSGDADDLDAVSLGLVRGLTLRPD